MGSMPAPLIPPRNIVLLLDGTANQFSDRNSNLIKLMSVIKSDDTQLVYYSSGVGTVLPESTSTWNQVKRKAALVIDMCLAWNFEDFVCNAYKYLMEYYRSGDKIYLFGFSRGAYTARALAGMIQRVGLLPAGCHSQVALAYEMYAGPETPKMGTLKGQDPCVLYRRTFGRSRPVFIKFMGVWDTVSSLGGFDLPVLPFAAGTKAVKFFRQALALDERRARFVPEYWRHDAGPEETEFLQAIETAEANVNSHPANPVFQEELDRLKKMLDEEYPTSASVGSTAGGRVLLKRVECWFMGCHSDVGGGNTLNNEHSLSHIPFRWMLRDAARCGLLLDPEGVAVQSALRIPGPSPDNALHVNTRRPNTAALAALAKLRALLGMQAKDASRESEQEAKVQVLMDSLPQTELVKVVEMASAMDSNAKDLSQDVLAEMTESLVGAWLFLEWLPLKTRDYREDGTKEKDRAIFHRGRPRQIIPSQKCHRSVLRRLMHDYDTLQLHDIDETVSKKGIYEGPAALVTLGWPDWDLVRRGEETARDIWED